MITLPLQFRCSDISVYGNNCKVYFIRLTLYVTDVAGLRGIEGQVADGSNQRINVEGDVTQDEVQPGSGHPTLGLQRSAVDDDAADPTQEEGQQETYQFVVIHEQCPPFSKDTIIVTVCSFLSSVLSKN